MSTQLSINEDLIQYLQKVGYRKDPLVDELEKETKALGKVAQMQIAKEQGQFLEIIVNISKAKACLEIGRFTGLSTLYMARGLPSNGKIVTVDNSDEFLPLAQKYWDKDGLTSITFDFALKFHSRLFTFVSNLTLTTLSKTIFGASLDTWVVPPKPVTLQNRSYKGTAAKDNPNIRTKIPAKSKGVNVLLLIISVYQILQRCIK